MIKWHTSHLLKTLSDYLCSDLLYSLHVAEYIVVQGPYFGSSLSLCINSLMRWHPLSLLDPIVLRKLMIQGDFTLKIEQSWKSLSCLQGLSYILKTMQNRGAFTGSGSASWNRRLGSKFEKGSGFNLETGIQCLTFTLLLAESHSYYYLHATSPGPRRQQPPPCHSPFFHERCPWGHHWDTQTGRTFGGTMSIGGATAQDRRSDREDRVMVPDSTAPYPDAFSAWIHTYSFSSALREGELCWTVARGKEYGSP